MTNQHWASVWGNAVSVAENRPERYAKDITIRYPINIPFSGSAIRLTFDNYCGTEPITLTKTTAFHGGEFYPVYFGGERSVTIDINRIYFKIGKVKEYQMRQIEKKLY